DEVVAVPTGARLDPGRVRPRARLGDGECADPLPAAELRQVSTALLLAPVQPDRDGADAQVRAQRQEQPGVPAAFLQTFERHTRRDDVGALSPVLLRNGQPGQPELADRTPHLGVPAAVAVARVGARTDDLLREVAYRGAEGKLLVGEREAERQRPTGRRGGEEALSLRAARRGARRQRWRRGLLCRPSRSAAR